MNIKIYFKDGTLKEFPHEGRAGGSYTKDIIYKNGFVMIEDEWGKRYVYPADRIDHVETTPNRY